MFVNFSCYLIMTVLSLVGVAFLTLLERKLLGYVQLRKGPNKVGLMGLFQPFSDAVKLFSKEFFFPLKSNFNLYWVSPIISFIVSVSVWLVFPYFFVLLSWKLGVLYLFSVLSFSIYGIMISGWASNSCYSILGALRVVAQSISYEVSFFLLILCILYFSGSMNLFDLGLVQRKGWFILFLFPIFIMLFVSFLAELNRTPFDFTEGESELVSGFNVEYGGVGFAFIFLSEYLSIIFSSVIVCIFFLGGDPEFLGFYLKFLFVSLIIILVRGTLPRYRYDKLMNMCWKSYLMVSLFMILFYLSLCL
uniref:NADH-ubiquinone oxidoreductase chain 1 n=1 Tax=Cacopsylla burckhardti TaxID=2593410 RepID=A0A8K1W1D7_9HEMI|nr:NADH dehydrogenase subunit 1 [Cacopsylla burckhardti]UFP91890.1 NADH dehydrogenase subunit 1 [Cacopsylla burckhardti]WAK85093.1 NADH dehydrogenase subunit 1 [Cacopsylla burckhardti]